MYLEKSCDTTKQHNRAKHNTVPSKHNKVVLLYVAIYDNSGILLNANKVPLELYNNTVISVDKNSNAQYAKIFVWINDMQPITNSEEISLIN